MRRARAEEGLALVSAMVVLAVLIAMGLALAVFADAQQRAATRQQSSEAAYALAEAALNAQVLQLSQQWATAPIPTCTPANAASTPGCPDPNSLTTAYPRTGPATCPAGAPTDAWGSPAGSQWATYVRDDGPGTGQLFNSSAAEGQSAFDANGNSAVWVRAVGVANCRMVVLVVKASEQLEPITWFPQFVLNANGFEISNHGNKVELDAKGNGAQPSQISVRCNGLTGPGQGTTCSSYPNSTQIASGPNWAQPAAPSPAISGSQLAAFKAAAMANSTYYPAGQCPAASQLGGGPTYIEGPCSYNINGGTINSASQPGFLILGNGTIELSGNSTFYGVIYALNEQGCGSGAACLGTNGTDVVYVHAGGQVVGAIDVDGNGTVGLGETGNNNVNLKYDPTAFQITKVLGGAAQTPNTFRILPQGQ